MSRIHDKLFKIHKWIYLQKCGNIVHQCFIHSVRLPNLKGLAEQKSAQENGVEVWRGG